MKGKPNKVIARGRRIVRRQWSEVRSIRRQHAGKRTVQSKKIMGIVREAEAFLRKAARALDVTLR